MSDRRDRNIRSTMRLRRLRRLRSFKSRTSHCSCYSLTSLCSSRSYSSSPPSRQLVRVTRGDSLVLSRVTRTSCREDCFLRSGTYIIINMVQMGQTQEYPHSPFGTFLFIICKLRALKFVCESEKHYLCRRYWCKVHHRIIAYNCHYFSGGRLYQRGSRGRPMHTWIQGQHHIVHHIARLKLQHKTIN